MKIAPKSAIHFIDFVGCFSQIEYEDHQGHKIVCKVCDIDSQNRLVYGSQLSLFNVYVIILFHLSYYHNIEIKNLMPSKIGNLSIYSDDDAHLWICDNYHVMFINNDIDKVERGQDLIHKILTSNYSCMICKKRFDTIPTKEIVLIHLKQCFNT